MKTPDESNPTRPVHYWKWDWPWDMASLQDWFFMVNHSKCPFLGGWHFHVRILGVRSYWFLPTDPPRP